MLRIFKNEILLKVTHPPEKSPPPATKTGWVKWTDNTLTEIPIRKKFTTPVIKEIQVKIKTVYWLLLTKLGKIEKEWLHSSPGA